MLQDARALMHWTKMFCLGVGCLQPSYNTWPRRGIKSFTRCIEKRTDQWIVAIGPNNHEKTSRKDLCMRLCRPVNGHATWIKPVMNPAQACIIKLPELTAVHGLIVTCNWRSIVITPVYWFRRSLAQMFSTCAKYHY